jgi:preprotein translocase subunit SecD
VLKAFNKLDCSKKNWRQQVHYTTAVYDNPNNQIVTCNFNPNIGFAAGTKFVLDKAKVLGKQVTSAQAGTANSQQSLTDKWQVNLSLNSKGAAAFGALTSELVSKYYHGPGSTPVLDDVAIVLDGQIVSAPQIQQAITAGNAQITYFPRAQAETLANQLNYGALPVTFKQQNVESVSPELGRNQLTAGLIAAAIGLGLVVVYSFFYYRGLGIVSVSSLIVAGLLAYLSVVLLSRYASSGFSLSLSGIAGLIVAIGITADSFVVYFERLRDEVREGKSLRPAVESGWKRARRTILVSDTVSFLAALLLWYFSISDVKGFAFTLGLTTLIDVVVVFLFTKPMVTLLARTRFFGSGHPLSGLDPARLGARAPWRSGLPRTAARGVREA